MSKRIELKHERIAAVAAQYAGHGVDARFAGYFILFNEQKFYEAHDVLEDLWLPDRHGPNGHFYKGLIQLAGAFVHLQKERLRPAAALFKLAQANLVRYPVVHEKVDLAAVHALIRQWLAAVEGRDYTVNPLGGGRVPRIDLQLTGTSKA